MYEFSICKINFIFWFNDFCVYVYTQSLHVLYSYTEKDCTNHITKLLSAHVAMDCIGSKNYVLLSVLKYLIYCIITCVCT